MNTATLARPMLAAEAQAQGIADVVLYTVTRPRGLRMMTVSLRPMVEGSWG